MSSSGSQFWRMYRYQLWMGARMCFPQYQQKSASRLKWDSFTKMNFVFLYEPALSSVSWWWNCFPWYYVWAVCSRWPACRRDFIKHQINIGRGRSKITPYEVRAFLIWNRGGLAGELCKRESWENTRDAPTSSSTGNFFNQWCTLVTIGFGTQIFRTCFRAIRISTVSIYKQLTHIHKQLHKQLQIDTNTTFFTG